MEPIIAHTIPFMVKSQRDIIMARQCIETLSQCENKGILVFYNQGDLLKEQLKQLMANVRMEYVVLGEGTNIGIPQARQKCFEWVWGNLSQTKYISELHLDMVFPPDWITILINFLEKSDEPMISPGIVTGSGYLHPTKENLNLDIVKLNVRDLLNQLPSYKKDVIIEGLVHPIIHKADCLKDVGGYNTTFLKGKQGFEDDALALGYRYYQGVKSGWRPKANLNSIVYHTTVIQRREMNDYTEEFNKNIKGIIAQYGIQGLYELADLHKNDIFLSYAEQALNSLYN